MDADYTVLSVAKATEMKRRAPSSSDFSEDSEGDDDRYFETAHNMIEFGGYSGNPQRAYDDRQLDCSHLIIYRTTVIDAMRRMGLPFPSPHGALAAWAAGLSMWRSLWRQAPLEEQVLLMLLSVRVDGARVVDYDVYPRIIPLPPGQENPFQGTLSVSELRDMWEGVSRYLNEPRGMERARAAIRQIIGMQATDINRIICPAPCVQFTIAWNVPEAVQSDAFTDWFEASILPYTPEILEHVRSFFRTMRRDYGWVRDRTVSGAIRYTTQELLDDRRSECYIEMREGPATGRIMSGDLWHHDAELPQDDNPILENVLAERCNRLAGQVEDTLSVDRVVQSHGATNALDLGLSIHQWAARRLTFDGASDLLRRRDALDRALGLGDYDSELTVQPWQDSPGPGPLFSDEEL